MPTVSEIMTLPPPPSLIWFVYRRVQSRHQQNRDASDIDQASASIDGVFTVCTVLQYRYFLLTSTLPLRPLSSPSYGVVVSIGINLKTLVANLGASIKE